MGDRLIRPDLFAVLFANFRVVAGHGMRAPGNSDQVGRRGDQGERLPPCGGFGGDLTQDRRRAREARFSLVKSTAASPVSSSTVRILLPESSNAR